MVKLLDVLDDKILDKTVGKIGAVCIVDVMPRLIPEDKTADYAITEAARNSYTSTKSMSDDRTLIRFMMRHRHSTPVESCVVKFKLVAPLYIFQQILRHRTASVNQESARYSVMKDEFQFFDPDDIRIQDDTNKQHSDGQLENRKAKDFCFHQRINSERSYKDYLVAIEDGVPREQARTLLPSNLMSTMFWKIDLHNLLHFLGLRLDSHAQKEIRDYAEAMYDLIRPIFPITCEAFEDYHPLRQGILLTRLEVEAIKTGEEIKTDNKREKKEWEEKKIRLGLK